MLPFISSTCLTWYPHAVLCYSGRESNKEELLLRLRLTYLQVSDYSCYFPMPDNVYNLYDQPGKETSYIMINDLYVSFRILLLLLLRKKYNDGYIIS